MINTTLPFPEAEQKRETTLLYPQSTPEAPPPQQSNLQPPPMAQQTIPVTNPPVADKLTQSMQQTIANQEPPQQATPQSEPTTAQEKKTRQKKEPEESKKPLTINQLLDESKSEFMKLGSIKDIDRFMRVNKTWLKLSPTVQQCNPKTILGAILTAAEWGLEPNTITGECCIVPRKIPVILPDGKEGEEMQAVFQMQAQGWITLAERLPDVERIDAYEVYEGDPYKVTLGLNPSLLHERAPVKERGAVIAYYAYVLMKNGYFRFVDMSYDLMCATVKAKSNIFKSSAWKTPGSAEFNEKAKWHLVVKVLKLMKGKMQKFAILADSVRFYDPNEPIEMHDIDMNSYEDADYTVEMDDTELLDISNETS